MEGNRQRFILKSGLLLSGEGEGGRGRRTDETEAAILPPPVQYGHASANCLSRPLVPDGERVRERREREHRVWKKRAESFRGGESEKWQVKQVKLQINW